MATGRAETLRTPPTPTTLRTLTDGPPPPPMPVAGGWHGNDSNGKKKKDRKNDITLPTLAAVVFVRLV